MINNCIAYAGGTYIRGFTVINLTRYNMTFRIMENGNMKLPSQNVSQIIFLCGHCGHVCMYILYVLHVCPEACPGVAQKPGAICAYTLLERKVYNAK